MLLFSCEIGESWTSFVHFSRSFAFQDLKIESTRSTDDDGQQATTSLEVIPYENELQMPDIMRLITKDLSEPYSIYTYRYFIHNWPELCFLVCTLLKDCTWRGIWYGTGKLFLGWISQPSSNSPFLPCSLRTGLLVASILLINSFLHCRREGLVERQMRTKKASTLEPSFASWPCIPRVQGEVTLPC